MNKKIIPGIGIGIAIIVMILATQNIQIEPENNIVETNVGCVSEFKIMFPDEDESKIKDLCDNSEPNNELVPYKDTFKITERTVYDCEKNPESCEYYLDPEVDYKDSFNINSHGLRGPEFTADKPEDVYRIVLVGGSTIIGSGNVMDETTIPGILQKIFDKQESQTKIEVINAGMSGANTISESKLIKERLVNFQPDLIVMYDGWNDLRADYSSEMIYDNWKSICQLGNKNGFDVALTLQPIDGFGDKKLTKQEYVNALTGNNHKYDQLLEKKDLYQEYADKLDELSSDCTTTKDFRGIFDDVEGSVFWDQGHTSETGNMIIAEKIYEISLPIIKDSELNNHDMFHNILKKYNNPTIISYILEQYDIFIHYDLNSLTDYNHINSHDGKYFELKQKFGVNNILVGKDLSNVDLSTINLVDQNLTGANLSGQNLTNIDLTETILINVDFTNANLSGLDLTHRNLSGSIFHETDFSETTWINIDCRFCKISNTNLSGLIFAEVQFDYATIVNSDLSNMRLLSTSFAAANISNVDFSNSDLSFDPQYVPYQIKVELDKFGMESDEIYNLDRKQFEDKVWEIYYPGWGVIPTYFLTNFILQDETAYVNFLIINSFVDANLSTVNFSNSDLTAVEFYGSTVSDLNLLNADLSCINQDFCSGEIFLTSEE